jgi:hypothetical protein
MNFKDVYAINVNDWTEQKNNLTYLSWAHAWRAFVEVYPNATYRIKMNDENIPAFGNSKFGYMVYTSVTVDDLTHEMWLPVMNHMNKTILEPNMFDINKTVMRCLTKNLAMFGLGLYIYAGEDIPNDTDTPETKQKAPQQQKQQNTNSTPPQQQTTPEVKTISQAQVGRLYVIAKSKGKTSESVNKWVKETYKVDSLLNLTKAQYDIICGKYEALPNVEGNNGQ